MSDPAQLLDELVAAGDWHGTEAWANTHAAVPGWEVAARTVAERLNRDRPHFEEDSGAGFTSGDERLFRGIVRVRRIAVRSGGVIEEEVQASNAFSYVVVVRSAGEAAVALSASMFQDPVGAIELVGDDLGLAVVLRELVVATEAGIVPRETALVPGNVVVLAPDWVAGEPQLHHLPTRFRVTPGSSLRPWLADDGVVALTAVGGLIRSWWVLAKIETEIAAIDRRVRRGGAPSSFTLQSLRRLCALRSALDATDLAAEPPSERARAVIAVVGEHADDASLCGALGWHWET